MPDEVSPSEAARRLGTTTRSVQRWIASGRLPARRVGGRWRVATDAIDAFAMATSSTPVPTAPSERPIGTLFIANRGEIAARIARTCDRLAIRPVVPTTIGPEALDLLDIAAAFRAAPRAGAGAGHPGLGVPAPKAGFS